jgi:hypothetical protein
MDLIIYLVVGVYIEDSGLIYSHPECSLKDPLEPLKSTFNGLIIENHGKITGGLYDVYGSSRLKEIKIENNQFAFLKCYENRKDIISYQYEKISETDWVGHYFGSFVGHGFTRCKLIPVPLSYFSQESIVRSIVKSD